MRLIISMAVVLAWGSAGLGQVVSIPATQPTTRSAEQVALEEQFEKSMSGVTMAGYSSDTRRPDAPPRKDGYTIQKVKKVTDEGDLWVFTVKMSMRGREMTVPLAIPIKWAGDTPVISVTDMTIPGFGTYTARVVIYRGQYAGTWSAGDHGGELWGKIERADGAATKPATTRASP